MRAAIYIAIEPAPRLGILQMSAREVKPWWNRVNDYYLFDERLRFNRGAIAYRPNNRQEALMAQMIAGYINAEFARPESIGKKKK